MNIVRAAVVQDSSIVFKREATIEKVHSLVRKAAHQGAQLVVMPEAFVSAYPAGLDFGARIGLRTPKGREDFKRYYDSAVEVPGPACEALGKAAQEAGVYLVIGVIERDGGTLYCTVLFFSPDGRLLGKHRKLMPTAMERLVWGFGDGSTLPVFDTPLGRIGSVICWENYMPMLRMHMYAQGIQFYWAPTADSRDTWLPSMRHIALDGRWFFPAVLSPWVLLGSWPVLEADACRAFRQHGNAAAVTRAAEQALGADETRRVLKVTQKTG